MDRYREWQHSHGVCLPQIYKNDKQEENMATMEFKVRLDDEEEIKQIIEMLQCYMNGSHIRTCQEARGCNTIKTEFVIETPEMDRGEKPDMFMVSTPTMKDDLDDDALIKKDAQPGQTASAVEVDSAGEPWDPKLHSAGKTKLEDGTWRRRRNSKPKAEVKPVPPPPPADTGMAPEEVSYKNMMDILKGKGLSLPEMNELANKVGFDSIALLVSNPESIPAVLTLAEQS